MTNYVFIESRDPFESRDTQFVEETALALQDRGHAVTVFLVQNGVLAARKQARGLNRLIQAAVNVVADDFSLAERGISHAELESGIQPSTIENLVDALLEENTKAIWH